MSKILRMGAIFSTWGLFPVELCCLTAITARSVGLGDVSEGNGQETQDRGKMVHSGTFLNLWAH